MLVLGTEGRVPALREREAALIFDMIVAAMRVERLVVGPKAWIEIMALDLVACDRDSVLQPASISLCSTAG